MSDTSGVPDEPVDKGCSSVEDVKEENEKDNEESMEVDVTETPPEDVSKVENKREETEEEATKEEEPKADEQKEESVEIENTETEEPKLKKEEEKVDAEEKVDDEDKVEEEKVEEEKGEEEKDGKKKKEVKKENEVKKEDEEKPSKKESKDAENEEDPEKPKENGEQPNSQPKKKQSPKKKEKADKDSQKLTTREHILDHIDFKRDANNRVKLYVLCDQRIWEDRGTGHVICEKIPADEEGKESKTMVLVRLEGQNKNMLESQINRETVYQKQQETLIVWSETDMMDLALSFQEKSGCEDLWQKICEVQGRDPSDADNMYDDGEDSDVGELSSSASRLTLPPIEIGRLSEWDALLHMHLSSNAGREKMTNAIENENAVAKLCEVFRMCEDIEHTEGLRTFYSLVKNLFMLNRNVVIEMLLDDANIKDVIGMFEFDPAYKHPRNHREFVYNKAKFREVVTISSDELRDKIHRLYRAQYIQDACLPSLGLFEENLLSTLGSHIFFCRIDIVSMLQKDKKAMRELFGQLSSPDTEVIRRRDLALFLKEMISLSTSIPSNGPATTKETFFKVLQLQNMFSNDIMDALEPCFSSPDHETRAVMVDVLKTMVDANAQMVRDFLLKQAKDKDSEDILLNRMITHLVTDIDVHLTSGSEMVMIMKTLLDPETMTTVKSERTDFMNLFYQKCLDALLKPLIDNVNGGVIKKDDYMTANRLSVIIRFLTFCIEHHSFSMRLHLIKGDLLNKSLVLTKSRHSFLVLSALKMLQKVVGQKDDKYLVYIVREKVLDPVMDCFRKNENRYNVVNSAILHLFDYVKSEDVKPLIKYVVENHMDAIENVSYVKTFREIKIRYDQHRDRDETMSVRSEDNSMASPRGSRKDRNEDQWFDDDEDLEVGTIQESIEKDVVALSPKKEENGPRKTGMEPMFHSVMKRKPAFDEDEAPVFAGGSATVLNHSDKKIVIKVNSERSPSGTPSPASSPRASASPGPSRDDEVTSSISVAAKEPSPAPTVKSLVDYDESDSDSDSDQASPDAIPSSSTGSPESDKEKSNADGKKVDSPEYNDVSSTSNEEKEESRALTNSENGTTSSPAAEISRKRTSDGLESNDVKRIRTDEVERDENVAVTAAVSQA